MTDQYAHYYDADGAWLAMATKWEDIRDAPRHRVWRLACDDGYVRLGRWAKSPVGGPEGWHSVVDPTLALRPHAYRDLVRPPAPALTE